MLCSQTNANQTVCNGDSGCPLVRQNDSKLLGIASFVGPKGCGSGLPQVFSNISSFYQWISKLTGIQLPKC